MAYVTITVGKMKRERKKSSFFPNCAENIEKEKFFFSRIMPRILIVGEPGLLDGKNNGTFFFSVERSCSAYLSNKVAPKSKKCQKIKKLLAKVPLSVCSAQDPNAICPF